MEDLIYATAWMTRSSCGWFPNWLILLYCSANILIWLSYESIPYTLRTLSSRGFRIFDDNSTRGFVTFIRMCGRGHLLENVLVFVYPNYLLFACWHAVTAIVSLKTAWGLRGLQQRILSVDEAEAVGQLYRGLMEIDTSNQTHHEQFRADLQNLKDLAKRLGDLSDANDSPR